MDSIWRENYKRGSSCAAVPIISPSRDKGRWRLEEALKKFGQTIQIEQEKKWQEEVVSRNC
jgi:hypothetical protein